MTRAKKLPTPKKPEYDPAAVIVGNSYLHPGEIESADTPEKMDELNRTVQARALSQPEVRSASVIQKFEEAIDVNALAAEMREQSAEVRKGNMGRAEAMLISQAHTLDALFSNLSRRAHGNMQAGYLQATETYLRLALRAQNQSRMTLESLSTIKNPPVVFAKQMNVAHGPQQVNNCTPSQPAPMAKDVTHTLENETAPNELGAPPYELLENPTAPRLTGRAMSQPETVGAIHRAENRGGESSLKP